MENSFKEQVMKKFGETLMGYGFMVQKAADEESGLETLRCAVFVSDEQAEPLFMDMTFYQLDTNPVLQFYGYVANDIQDGEIEALRPVISEFNTYAPIGHMGIYEEGKQLYYRYSLVFEKDETVEAALARSETILELMILMLRANYEKFRIKAQ